MKHTHRTRTACAWSPGFLALPGLLALIGLAGTLRAQGEGQEPPLPVEPVELAPHNAPQQEDLQQQMIELIYKVEQRLKRIDRRLSDAGAGVRPLGEVEDSGLDDLLRQAQEDSQQNVSDIDKILEIAQQMGGSQGSSGSPKEPQDSQPGESPLDSERDRGPQERENTPSEPPQEEPGGEQPQGQAQDQETPKPDQNPPGGENREGDPRNDGGGAGASAADDANRWGELPVRYREVFRNQGGDDLPVQYRDWIDAYHRRLSKTRR